MEQLQATMTPLTKTSMKQTNSDASWPELCLKCGVLLQDVRKDFTTWVMGKLYGPVTSASKAAKEDVPLKMVISQEGFSSARLHRSTVLVHDSCCELFAYKTPVHASVSVCLARLCIDWQLPMAVPTCLLTNMRWTPKLTWARR